MKRVLVTGVSGMDGAHLCRYLWQTYPGCEVHGLVRSTSHSRVLTDVEWRRIVKHIGDVTDAEGTVAAVRAAEPTHIFHLAAQSYVSSSFSAAESTLQVNVMGTLHVLDAARKCPGVRVLIAGSSEEYGAVAPSETPIKEGQPVDRCLSAYGVSKVAADVLGYQYWRSYRLHVVRARAFNHFGPGRGNRFAEGAWCESVARIEAGLQEPVIYHGNLEAVRDYTDARDVVRAYCLLLEQGTPGDVYNVASGRGYTMGSVLERIVELSRVKGIRCTEDPTRLRPSDVPLLIGDASKILVVADWRPALSFEQSLRDLLDWHRREVARG